MELIKGAIEVPEICNKCKQEIKDKKDRVDSFSHLYHIKCYQHSMKVKFIGFLVISTIVLILLFTILILIIIK